MPLREITDDVDILLHLNFLTVTYVNVLGTYVFITLILKLTTDDTRTIYLKLYTTSINEFKTSILCGGNNSNNNNNN